MTGDDLERGMICGSGRVWPGKKDFEPKDLIFFWEDFTDLTMKTGDLMGFNGILRDPPVR